MAPLPQSQHFDTWNPNVNMFVPAAQFSADIDYLTGEYRADYGSVATVSAVGVLNGQNMTAAGNTNVFVAGYRAALGPYGRQLSFVGPAGATGTLTVQGRDYMGQPIRETVVMTAATPVNSAKIYRQLDLLTWTANASATAVNVGFTDVLGVPYRTIAVQNWLENNLAATAGALVAGLPTASTPTATSVDPRGSIDFASASNGVMTFSIIGLADLTSLYGGPHFS